MIGEVNVIATLGPAGAGPALSGVEGPSLPETDEGAATADFASLLDEAAAEMLVAPNATPAKDAGAAKAFAPVFIAEWCVGASDASTAVEPEHVGDEPVDADKPQANTEEDDATDAVVLEGVMNIDWLLAQPKRMPVAVRSDDNVAQSNEPAVETAVVATPSPAKVATPAIAHDNKNAVVAELPKQAETPANDFKEAVNQAESAPEPQVPAVPTVKAERTANTSDVKPVAKTPHVTAAVVANVAEAAPVANTPAAAQPAIASTDGEAVVSVDAPKSNGTSTRLAKAIERVFGGTTEAAPHVKPSTEAGDTAGNGGTLSSSSHENAAANAAPAPRVATATGPAFTVHVTPEVSKAVEVAAAMVEAPLPASTHVPEADTVRQLVQTMRMQFRDGIGDAVVRLRPEHLGEVWISLRVDQHSVSATVHAEQAAVRSWLESQEALLRSGLAEHGLNLEKFVVREDAQQNQQHADHKEAQRRNREARRQRQTEGEPRFEITV